MSVMVAENAETIPDRQGNSFRIPDKESAEYIPLMSSDFQIRLRTRMAELGLSRRATSLEAGLSAEAVGKMLSPNAGPPRGGSLAGLARALRTTEQWLLTGRGDHTMSDAPADKTELVYADESAVEIKAVAAGSYEGAFQLFDNSIGHAPLPRGLRRYADVYAIVVLNDSMVPEHKPGALRYVTPQVKPRLGDSVVVEFVRDPDQGPEAMIGHLQQNGATIKIAKLNPAGEVEISSRSVIRLHRIAPESEVAGF